MILAALLASQDPAATLEQQAAAVLEGNQPFTARADVADAVGRAIPGVTDQERHGRLSLLYIRTLRSALGAIPMDARDREPYRSFLERHQDETAYSEPAGRWMLTPDAIWKIHDASRRSSSAEPIAWEAVDNGMPGECEGYPPCELATLDALDGEYLRRHPNGVHAPDSIRRIGQTCVEIERLLDAPNGHELFDPVTDCKDLTPKADALRLAMTSGGADASALGALAELRARCP